MTSAAGSRLVMVVLGLAAWPAGPVAAGVPALPDGALTRWEASRPEEIVTYLTFDPARVAHQLPGSLRFITVGELAAGGVAWAADDLAQHPAHAGWGVSFLEIARFGTFTIDGRSPVWPDHGAVGLWCARVAPRDTTTELGPGRPLLMLEFWIPDRAFAAFVRARGHFATYGDVRLWRSSGGQWRGSVTVRGLSMVASAVPAGPVSGGPGSAGSQIFLPPRDSGMRRLVRVAFAGHRVQECDRASVWRMRGTHPLAGASVLPPTMFEDGYELVGGAYPWRSGGE